jgi:catechol 2,3-dioxygenase-like lactoylglutathione lyase family enzyme
LKGAFTLVPQRLSLVTLGARNLPELRRFYKQLGWSEREQSSDDFAVFQTAGVLLSLFPIAELAKDAGVPLREAADSFAAISLAINVDNPADVDAAIASVAAAGARILRQPSDAFWGGRTAYFADPENNLWEVAWNPTAVFDERGGMVSF